MENPKALPTGAPDEGAEDLLRSLVADAARVLLGYLSETGVAGFQPRRDRVCAYPLVDDLVRKRGSIYTVSDNKGRSMFYEVVSIGSAVSDVRPGDVIVAGEWIGHPVEFAGVSYRMIKAGDILAVVR